MTGSFVFSIPDEMVQDLREALRSAISLKMAKLASDPSDANIVDLCNMVSVKTALELEICRTYDLKFNENSWSEKP